MNELNMNKLINEYVKPKHSIYKLYYFIITVKNLNEDDDDYHDPDGYIPKLINKTSIVEAISFDKPLKKDGLGDQYEYTDIDLISNDTSVPLQFINEIYNPNSSNGLYQNKPVVCSNYNCNINQTIYKVEKLA